MIWVGPKHSDLYNDRGFFDTSITFCGPGGAKNASLTGSSGKRINYNAPDFTPGAFFANSMKKKISEDPNVKFMFYNPLHVFFYSEEIIRHCLCVNSRELLEHLDTKPDMRIWASRYVPIVPFEELEGGRCRSFLQQKRGLHIIQDPHSSGGFGTTLYDAENPAHVFAAREKVKYLVSPYYGNSVPVNLNLIIYEDGVFLFPPSIQIIHIQEQHPLYMGADYPAFSRLPHVCKEKVREYGKRLGEQIRSMGYSGILGIDFLVTEDEVLFLEVNARFQASTFLLNGLLEQEGVPTVYEMNLHAFQHRPAPKRDLFFSAPSVSCIAYLAGTEENIQLALDQNRPMPELEEVLWDGYDQNAAQERFSYLFRCVYKDNLCCVNPEMRVNIHPNIIAHSAETRQRVTKIANPAELKILLLNQGVAISDTASALWGNPREGVHCSIDLFLENLFVVNCPTNVRLNALSSFLVDADAENRLFLSYYGRFLSNVRFDAPDPGQSRITVNGVRYSDCCFLATDRLRIHHAPICHYKANGTGCAFCNAASDNIPFDLGDTREVLEYYCARPDVNHFLIGGGSSAPSAEQGRILRIVKMLREISQKNIYVMCLPPEDTRDLDALYRAGVTEIAFNIEIYDREIAGRVMPGKGNIPVEQYMRTLSYAAELWGKSGNVRTLFVVGLEPAGSLLYGIEAVCSLGTQPILSVFRPLPGTALAHLTPPDNEWLLDIYNKAEKICVRYGKHLGPSCPLCQNNTIAMPEERFEVSNK